MSCSFDHLDKMSASARYAGIVRDETREKSQGLAALAKDLNVSMVALHQLNRATESRAGNRPELADLKHSGDLEADADNVGLLYREAYYLERSKFDEAEYEEKRKDKLRKCINDLDLIIAKNRNGPIATVELFCDMGSNVVRNKAR